MAGVLGRVKLRWSGFQGGPGYTVLHFGAFPHDTFDSAMATYAATKTDAFIQAVKPYIPYQATLETMADVEVIDITSGDLVGIETATVAAPAVSTQSLGQLYMAAAGAVINWKSNEIRNGRRMRGRSFLVPLGINITEQNGTLTSGFLTAMNSAAAALRATGGTSQLYIYGRPSAPGATDGTVGGVIGHSIPDFTAVLRSRRD